MAGAAAYDFGMLNCACVAAGYAWSSLLREWMEGSGVKAHDHAVSDPMQPPPPKQAPSAVAVLMRIVPLLGSLVWVGALVWLESNGEVV